MRSSVLRFLAIAIAAGLLASCSHRHRAAHAPNEDPGDGAHTIVLLPIAYGRDAKGAPVTRERDACDVPVLLSDSIRTRAKKPHRVVAATVAPPLAGATLKIEVTSLLANAGGLYGGPKIVQLRGVLERAGEAPVSFTARREKFLYFGIPKSTCTMVKEVTDALGGDIVHWLDAPVDGATLGIW